MYKEKRSRSIAKAVTYRLMSIIMDTILAYVITKSIKKTATLVIISNILSIILYYGHERIWNKHQWAKIHSEHR